MSLRTMQRSVRTSYSHPYTNPPSDANKAMADVLPLWIMPLNPVGPANCCRFAERASAPAGDISLRLVERQDGEYYQKIERIL